MSVELLLIPLGIAAVAAIREARSTDLCEKCRATRIKDTSLLLDALERAGVTDVIANNEDRVIGRSAHGTVTFQRVGETFLGRVDGNEQATVTLLADLDRHVGLLVQEQNVRLVRERAATLGYRLITEQDDDGAVRLVFEEVSA